MCTNEETGEYRFDCPLCTTTVSKSAENRTLDLLIASGVRALKWSVPVERIANISAAPVSYDDIIDFHTWIDDDEAVAYALGQLANQPSDTN